MTTYFTSIGGEQGLNLLSENPCGLIDFARLALRDGARHSGETGQREVLLVLFRAVVAAGKREDQRIAALEFAQRADRAGVVGQRVIGEDSAGNDVGTHGKTASHLVLRTRPTRSSADSATRTWLSKETVSRHRPLFPAYGQ